MGLNLWVWVVGMVVKRYIDFLILFIPTPSSSVLFLQHHPYFRLLCKKVFVLYVFLSFSNN